MKKLALIMLSLVMTTNLLAINSVEERASKQPAMGYVGGMLIPCLLYKNMESPDVACLSAFAIIFSSVITLCVTESDTLFSTALCSFFGASAALVLINDENHPKKLSGN